MMKRFLLIAALTVALTSAALPQNTNEKLPPQAPTKEVASQGGIIDKSAQVDALLSAWSQGQTPGAVVMVVHHGRVVHKKGYGLANIETKTPLGPDIAFDLASVSKQFTAMAVMILAERGKLSFDDPLSKFFPEFPVYARKITVRHLLNHTSGLPDYIGLFVKTAKIDREGKEGGFEPAAADVIKLLSQQQELLFSPGDKWEYSNSGYVVLAMIVEKASGKAFPQFVRENILQPLAMTNTIVYDQTRPRVKMRATSYARRGSEFKNADYHPLNLIYGDGGVNTTAEDLYKWDQALYTEKLVKASTLNQAFTPAKLNDGRATNYGFGWIVGKKFGLDSVSHGGAWAGFKTFIARYPAERFTVIVLSNLAQFRPAPIATKIAQIYLRDKMTFPVATKIAPEILGKYVGRYKLADESYFDVMVEDGALKVKPAGQSANKLVPESEVKFFIEGSEDVGFTFNKDEKGEINSLTLHQGGDHVAKKVSSVVPRERQAIKVDAQIYDAYTGQYELAPSFIISITREGDKLMAQATGQPKFELFPESETRYFLKVVDAQITFVRNERGQITQLILHQNGRDMPANKIK